MKYFREHHTPGHEIEREVLGRILPEYEGKFAEKTFMKIEQWIEVIKEFQPFKDPSLPEELKFPDDLHATIIEKLNNLQKSSGEPETEYDRTQLRYYTCVGTALDDMGFDAIFEFDVGNGENITVTIDITTNRQKGDYKADVCFEWPDISRKDDRIEWGAILDDVSERVVRSLLRKAMASGRIIRPLSQFETEESKTLAQQGREEKPLRLPRRSGLISREKRYARRH